LSYTREDLEGMKMSDLRELTDAKSVRREDLIHAILRTPAVDLPDPPAKEGYSTENPGEVLPNPAYEIDAPERWTPKREWLDKLANQYKIDRFVWVENFRAYRVFVNGKHVDWITAEQLHKLFGEPIPRLKRSRMPQRPMKNDRIIKHID